MGSQSFRTNNVNQERLKLLAKELNTTPNALLAEGLKLIFQQHNIPWADMPPGPPARIRLSIYARELFGSQKAFVTAAQIVIAWPQISEISMRGTSRWWARFDELPSRERLGHGAEVIADEQGNEIGHWIPISD